MLNIIRDNYLAKNAGVMRSVFVQLLFVWLAFFLMVSISYFFIKDIVHGYLIKDAEATLSHTQAKITTDLLEAETTLQSVSQSARSIILNGGTENDLRKYLSEISEYLSSNEIRTSSFSGVYGAFDAFGKAFLDGSGWVPPDGYEPMERPWYKHAVEENGRVAVSKPYTDLQTHETVITYSRRIFDYEGNPLGVVAVDAQLDRIGRYVANTRLAKGGYGLLASHDLNIISAPDRETIGKELTALPSKDAFEIIGDLKKGAEIYERVVTNGKGEAFVIFSRKLDNGWYLGILTPVDQYYLEVTNMKRFIVALGIILALMLSFILLRIAVAKQKSDIENRQKSSFLATMSHEMRTPMNAILGISEIQLQDGTLADSSKEAFGKIYKSGYQLLNLINDVLDLSKVEAGRMELVLVEYDVASLINDTVQLNMMHIGNKPIEVSLRVDENIPSRLLGDELRIKRVISNVLSNAFKYTDKGRVDISFAVGKENSQLALVFKVSDTGQGMTEKQVSKLFDEYARFNLEANRATEGTGLGMSITKRLVQMMSGKIFVESKFGEGSAFTVRLPQKIAGSASAAIGKEVAEKLQNFNFISAAHIKKSQITYEPMPYGKVLIVDDLETNLYVAKGYMLPYELSIDTAMSGFEAIEKVKAGKTYDIVFMDHMMPKMDGIEAAKIMREMGYARPILALTANAVVGQAEIFLKNGFDGFISKPINISELNAALVKFISSKQQPEVVEEARKHKNESAGQPAGKASSELLSIFSREAKNAAKIISAAAKQDASDEELRAYTISVHAMKSALANIGEKELSAAALKLENAGREKNIGAITSQTPSFLKAIEALANKHAAKEEQGKDEEGGEAADDPAYLQKLRVIKAACAEYNGKAAKEALAELKQKQLSNSSKKALGQISEHVLHSDFEEAITEIEKILSHKTEVQE